MPESTVHGFVADNFSSMREAFEANFADGADVGASCCATLDGETVVDLWGGFADAAQTEPWERNTIVAVHSTTKTMAALTALLLADRGELDFDAPVARYWPEFAANGKERIKVSQVMSHSSGLSGWKEPLKTEDLYDWEKMTSLLAAQAPLWEPGTASGYHVVTFGFLIGEVVRRIAGKSLGAVFREEIAEPLDADFHIGLPASEDSRVAETIPWPSPQTAVKPVFSKIQELTFLNMPYDIATTIRTRAWRAAEIPAVNGFGNARSIAEIHAILANGGVVRGKRFLSETGCRKALEPQIEGLCWHWICPTLTLSIGAVEALPGSSSTWTPAPHLLTRQTKWTGGR